MYELDKEKIGKFIAQLRKEKGMTQKQMAEKLNVSDKSVSKWETGNGVPVTEEENTESKIRRKKAIRNYIISVAVAVLEMLLLLQKNSWEELGISLMTFVLLAIFFGGYFTFFVKEKLPVFYDENQIGFYTDGFLKLHMPGIRFNNHNWQHIVAAVQKSMNILMIGYPLFWIVVMIFLPEISFASKQILDMIIGFSLGMGAIFVPIYVTARKYQ